MATVPGAQQVTAGAQPILRRAAQKRSAPSPTSSPQNPGGPTPQPGGGPVAIDPIIVNSAAGGGGVFNPVTNTSTNGPGGLVNTGAGGGGVVGREAIDPSQRGDRLTFGAGLPTVSLPQVGSPGGLDFSGFGLDPSQFGQGGQFSIDESGLGGGFNVNAQSVLDQALQAFRSQLPQADLRLQDATEGLAKRTSALGRTGSGLFNRDTDRLTERERAARESLLGNLSFQGATTDAANDLQAQIATGQFDQSAADRLLRARSQGSGQALQAALANARNNLQGQQFDINNVLATDRFNAGQQTQQNLFNTNQQIQRQLDQLGLGERQQRREDQLASQAQNDLATQLQLLSQGFGSNPAQTQLGGGSLLAQLAGMFGSNASQTSAGAGAAGQQAGGLLTELLGGGGGAAPGVTIPSLPAPSLPPPQPTGVGGGGIVVPEVGPLL